MKQSVKRLKVTRELNKYVYYYLGRFSQDVEPI